MSVARNIMHGRRVRHAFQHRLDEHNAEGVRNDDCGVVLGELHRFCNIGAVIDPQIGSRPDLAMAFHEGQRSVYFHLMRILRLDERQQQRLEEEIAEREQQFQEGKIA